MPSSSVTDDDVQLFRAAVAGVLKSGGSDALPAPDPEWRAQWPALVELGVTALCVPEAQGGMGLQVEVAAGTAAELGAALHGSPYAGLVAGTHALASTSMESSGADTRALDVLARVVDGGHICAYGRLDANGSVARTVDGAPVADALVLEDPSTGDLVLLDDPASWSPTGAPPAFDVTRSCADVTVDVTAGHRFPSDPTAAHLYRLLLAADALGGTERALTRTVAYARDRQAFGRPIGGFQAVQHRLVDHSVRVRGLGLLVREAARSLAAGGPDAARRVALAEAGVSGAASHVLHDLLQLTGAVGFTWEYGHHFFQRRAHHDARLAANPRRAHQAVAESEGWTGAH